MQLAVLLAVSTLGLSAAPITFTAVGSVSPIANGWFVTLQQFNNSQDRWAEFTASEGITGLTVYADNLPNSVGSGWRFYLDEVEALNTGIGELVQRDLVFSSAVGFKVLRVEANYAPGTLERGKLTNFRPWGGIDRVSETPEPGTGALWTGVMVVGLFGWFRKFKF